MNRFHNWYFVWSLALLTGVAQAATYKVVPTFPDGVKVGAPTSLRFSLYRGNSNEPLTAKDLTLEHERLIHLLALDSGFLQYHHEHPAEVSPGVWEVKLPITVAGGYRIWLQFLPEEETSTKTVFFDQKFLSKPGEVVATAPVDSSIKLASQDGEYEAKLSFPEGEPIPHMMVPLKFTVSKNGAVIPPDQLEKYLGAKFHVVGVSADKKDFVHAHPGPHFFDRFESADAQPEDVVKVHFMKVGFYGVFAQFQHAGKVRTVQFGLSVKPREHD